MSGGRKAEERTHEKKQDKERQGRLKEKGTVTCILRVGRKQCIVQDSAGNEGRRRMMETCEKSMEIREGGKDQGQGDDLPQTFISPKIFNREDNSV